MYWLQNQSKAGRFIVISGLVVGYALNVAPVNAQNAGKIPADLKTKRVTLKAQKQSLAEMVAALSSQIEHGILVDGESNLPPADFDLQGTVAEALDKVADTFDYTWSVTKGDVILMHKRFRKPEEYPQLNLPEMRQMAQEVVTVLHTLPFDPNISPSDRVTALARSFTSAQIQMLQSRTPLRGSDLLPQQAELLRQTIMTHYYAPPLAAWELLITRLEAMPRSYLQMREWPTFYQKQMGKPVEPYPGIPNHWQFSFVSGAGTLLGCLPLAPPAQRIGDQ